MRIEDVVCSFCGCLCDDLVVEVEGTRVINVENGCTLANEKFMGDHRLEAPIRRSGGKWEKVSYEEAIAETAGILLDADRPLLYGWSGTYGEAQTIGVHLAEVLGAVIDNTSTVCHGPSIMAIQEVGHPGCTLGQVKNRADVVVYWGANPVDAHPRHMSRYTTYCDGFFVKNAFRERKVVVVDVRETESSQVADEFVKVNPGGDYAVLSALRAIVRGKRDIIPPDVEGVSREQLFRVADMCIAAKFGAFFFGVGLTMAPGKNKNIRNAIELTEELNRHTKFTISPMRGHWNVYGSNEVFTWITGYPFAVDFARGIAFYNPGETTSVDILRRGECDACLVVASDPGAHFPRACAEHLARIPTVQIDPHVNVTTHLSRIQIPVAVAGIDAEGTAYRMDGVPIRTRKLFQGRYPDDLEVLEKIYAIVKEAKG
ncbi:MAG TPA: formylmethanofuran dehydrogenase subunit B [Methanolinea sp.]|jgi:formylmethanofuran dehydrogenase subunit B|nr:MAG: Formate dehydrogenase subunit alpha [Methanoregulaceae archaeon PtaB.Bin009]OPY41703.1 MAG: Formate dehydrogenase subunit alpha [Methanoregulaceae archaeon PtaU1.Bin066]HII77105.1 formylmethanofuran dehydrogenase subunit B [Methanolinea sp.]HNQ29299.1 formylmethanofuran dehydrogenase subunit B [Methanolinea sp.]